MPYTRNEAQSFTKKATTDARRRQWEHVAQYYLVRGYTEAQAIRAANAAGRRKYPRQPRITNPAADLDP